MPRYLTDEDVYTVLTAVYHHHTDIQHKALRDAINSVPTADVVERSAYDQVRWERDVAIAQLASIGKGFGEAMDDVGKVVRCKDCKWCEDADGLMCKNVKTWVVATGSDFGCILAERRDNE